MKMDRELLRRVIIDQKDLAKPEHDHYISRDKEKVIRHYANTPDVVIISGIRRCGKSTLLNQVRKLNRESHYYLNFDDDRLVHFGLSDFQVLYELFMELYGIQNTFYFDEIQNIPEWERFVRRLHEQKKKVYITGSNASLLSKELSSRLTGRHISIELYPYSFRELVRNRTPELVETKNYSSEQIGILLNQFKRYVDHGGIPEYLRSKDIEYLHFLYKGIVYRDIIARYKLPNERPIRELVYYLASQLGKETTYNSLKKTIGIASSSTVAEYCSYLENSYMCFFINRYAHSLKKQIQSKKKHYFVDHSIARTVGFRVSKDSGRLLENIIFIELKRRGHDVFFHQENKECDFVIRDGVISHAIQVCLSLENDATKAREIEGLIEAMVAYDLDRGTIITSTEEYQTDITVGKKKFSIDIIPAYKWLIHQPT